MIKQLCFAIVLATTMCPTFRTAEPAARFRVTDLAWLAGTWRTPAGEQPPSEETWAEPEAGTMIGMFRMAAPGKSLFEFLLLEDDDKGIIKHFKHYRSGFAELEKDPLTLRVTELTEKKVVFMAAVEGKLKSIIYQRVAPDKLEVTVNTTRGDKPHQILVKMERVKGK